MIELKRLAAGVIAGAAIASAPVIAFAGPASAATNAADPAAGAALHSRALSGAQDQLGTASSFAMAHAMHCGGGMHCSDCGCS